MKHICEALLHLLVSKFLQQFSPLHSNYCLFSLILTLKEHEGSMPPLSETTALRQGFYFTWYCCLLSASVTNCNHWLTWRDPRFDFRRASRFQHSILTNLSNYWFVTVTSGSRANNGWGIRRAVHTVTLNGWDNFQLCPTTKETNVYKQQFPHFQQLTHIL